MSLHSRIILRGFLGALAVAAVWGAIDACRRTSRLEIILAKEQTRQLALARDKAQIQQAVATVVTSNSAERAQLNKGASGHAKNHLRILRMLAVIDLERAKMPPSNPAKLTPMYGLIASGNCPDLFTNPSYLAACRITAKYDIETQYGSLLKAMQERGVDPEKLVTLLFDQETAGSEAQALAFQEHMSSDAAQAASNAASAEVTANLQAFLGTKNYGDLEAYNLVLRGAYDADQLQNRLSYASTPMTSEQYRAYALLMGSPSAFGTPSGNRAMLESAKTFLNADQYETLVEFRTDLKTARR